MIRRPELYLADKDIPSLLSAIVMQAGERLAIPM